MMGVYEFAPSDDLLIKGGQLMCKEESPFQEICANFLFILCGFNSQQLNRTVLPEIMKYTPAGKDWIRMT
jgi:lysosomal acid lipase/cholesteryl ester hydrolase